MSWIDSLFRGFRPSKANDKTIPRAEYRDKPYNVTKHAVQRMNERNISKGDLHVNLHTKPIQKGKVKYDDRGRPSYERVSDNKIVSEINPQNKKVTTVHSLHTKEYNKIKKR